MKIGTMFSFSHIVGNLPLDSERVNGLASDDAMLFAVVLSMKAEIPSGPLRDVELLQVLYYHL